RVETEDKKPILNVKNLYAMGEDNTLALDNLSFNIQSGEILGVAGVAGSGQRELCEVIAGLYPVLEGEIAYKDNNIIGKNPREIIKMGISMSFVPEDRLGMGLIASMDIVDNILLKEYQNQRGILLSRKPSRDKANKIVEKLNIATPDIRHPVRKLSGGNIQKVLLGREIETNPNLIITAYPARGLDIGAAYTVYDLLNEQKKKGVGILFIGEDLDVLMELCDRILVLCDGKITGIVQAENVTKEELGFMMAGEILSKRNDNFG
ncbi:MAG: ATP-binding cassette domain-containing protein, partial [Clostridia bacterium]|nr:ATP-binding cassette domain-containing protein [Clostridia bacterium]